MKRFVTLLALLPVLLLGIRAEAKVGVKNMTPEAVQERFCIEYLVPVPEATDTTSGQNGVVFATANTGTDATDYTFTVTTSVADMPYPAKLKYVLTEDSSGGTAETLTGTTLVIDGIDQFGKVIQYTDATITETAETTTQVFARVTKISAIINSGSEGSDADYFTVYVSPEVGLNRKVRKVAEVESLCLDDGGAYAQSDVKCSADDDGTTGDIESAIELASDSIDLSTASLFLTATAADNDVVCWAVRPDPQ